MHLVPPSAFSGSDDWACASQLSAAYAARLAAGWLGLVGPEVKPNPSVGASALSAAAWLRSRGASVGHVVSERVLLGSNGPQYANLARYHQGSALGNRFRFGDIPSRRLARWFDADRSFELDRPRTHSFVGKPRRLVILFVTAWWKRAASNLPHALLLVAAADGSATIYDPAGRGLPEDISFDDLDALRGEEDAAWECLLVGGRRVEKREETHTKQIPARVLQRARPARNQTSAHRPGMAGPTNPGGRPSTERMRHIVIPPSPATLAGGYGGTANRDRLLSEWQRELLGEAHTQMITAPMFPSEIPLIAEEERTRSFG